ncbi:MULTISPECIES: single-stranded DNA-binding protein [Spiroplasma]|nr:MULTISPECIES: single-stranded DNA-binding protein [Spiroplasma]ELL44153.1 single-stranded DNA-binding protein [Spiroplasma melliferum IPMB4A]PQP78130.1 single-stranded DNA-binding protein [Spiroplasma sp. ChiS]PQP78428.1 single-stranded DNA-binding protein [Spiroplasma sp. ChiS]
MNQVILVGQVEGTYEIIYDKKEAERKLMKFLLKIQRPFKNKDGNYDSDLVNVKVWTNNIDDLDISLRDKAIIAVKGRIQSFRSNNFDEENYYNDIIADRVTYLSSFN